MRNLFVIIWVLLLFPLQKSWGQSGGYNDYYEGYSIQTKAAKWHDLQNEFQISAADRFEGVKFWEIAGGKVQGAHTSVDTLYVHTGTQISLSLPDKLDDYSIKTYQRWYDIRRLSTFKTLSKVYNWNYDDLLMPATAQAYRFKNGYVGSPLTGVLDYMYFYYPTKIEFEQMFPGNTDPNLDNNYYLVACDVSGYNDYTEKYDKQTSKHSQFGAGGYYWEPTLSHRVIYYICNVDDNENASYVKRWKQPMPISKRWK